MDYDENEKEEVDIQDISPDFLQSLFDLKVTPGILKTADGKKIPIKQERLQPNETYTLLTSKSEKKKKLSKNYIFPNDSQMSMPLWNACTAFKQEIYNIH